MRLVNPSGITSPPLHTLFCCISNGQRPDSATTKSLLILIPLPALGSSPCWSLYTESLRHVHLPEPTPCTAGGLSDRFLPSPHSLRREGTTLAYHMGVQIHHINTHGTCLPDAVNAGLQLKPNFPRGPSF